MRIAIAGSGALGSGFGANMFKNGYDVTLIDGWQEHVNAIKRHGLNVEMNDVPFQVEIPVHHYDQLKDVKPFDVIFFFTKSMYLEEMLEKVKHLIHDQTVLVSIMNGLNHERVMSNYVDDTRILRGVTTWTASIKAPGETVFLGQGPVEIGAIVDGAETHAKAIETILQRSNLNPLLQTNIHASIWKKICINATVNTLGTLLDANLMTLKKANHMDDLLEQIIHEISDVAEIDNVSLDVPEMVAYLHDVMEKVGPHYPSMHQDLVVKNRLTEIDYINGEVANIARRHGIPAPCNTFITHLIHAKESIMDAK
ncbi:2-dehydropantoate 2-reductase [Staphylococcus massiliensis]|uniref:ketopantoate reductase family protein n=1 Tax=Staphylococcus massiliensis TaxID=555791 RepID=UPI001EE0BC99|nr:2-dehydropantoate 2-reductase [Staphylococcus massiliensis]MCG3401842.1 2-dehydropantoate 2-reductase [Staphylococcus massiliensis]